MLQSGERTGTDGERQRERDAAPVHDHLRRRIKGKTKRKGRVWKHGGTVSPLRESPSANSSSIR